MKSLLSLLSSIPLIYIKFHNKFFYQLDQLNNLLFVSKSFKIFNSNKINIYSKINIINNYFNNISKVRGSCIIKNIKNIFTRLNYSLLFSFTRRKNRRILRAVKRWLKKNKSYKKTFFLNLKRLLPDCFEYLGNEKFYSRFSRPRYVRELDFWGFNNKFMLTSLAKTQLNFFIKSPYLKYKRFCRYQLYTFSLSIVYDSLFCLLFYWLIYSLITNFKKHNLLSYIFDYLYIIDIRLIKLVI
jgi:Holliday junction resolvase-like predicted endonuclease